MKGIILAGGSGTRLHPLTRFKIGCVEEITRRLGDVDGAQLFRIAEPVAKSGYDEYMNVLVGGVK